MADVKLSDIINILNDYILYDDTDTEFIYDKEKHGDFAVTSIKPYMENVKVNVANTVTKYKLYKKETYEELLNKNSKDNTYSFVELKNKLIDLITNDLRTKTSGTKELLNRIKGLATIIETNKFIDILNLTLDYSIVPITETTEVPTEETTEVPTEETTEVPTEETTEVPTEETTEVPTEETTEN